MANSKISALTSATTPLAGTETLPVVQSSATTKVTVANLTAGRAVSASSLTLTSALAATSGGTGSTSAFTTNGVAYASSTTALSTGSVFTFDGTNVALSLTGSPSWSNYNVYQARSASFSGATNGLNDALFASNMYYDGTNYKYIATTQATQYRQVNGQHIWYSAISGTAGTNITFTQAMTLSAASNLTLNVGNIVQGTAAKGFDFSANTPLAGKTSTILNWYEEGTWTPNQGAGLTLVGAFSSTGKYTRVGRNVTVSGTVTGATSVAVTAAGVVTTNLPFTIGTAGHGNATNAAITASAAVICNTGTTLTSAGAIAATGTITFSATYFV